MPTGGKANKNEDPSPIPEKLTNGKHHPPLRVEAV